MPIQKNTLIIHALFWAVYFSFFMYQISPFYHREDNHRKEMPAWEKPLLPPHDASFHHQPPPHKNFMSERTTTLVIFDSLNHVFFMMLLAYSNYFYFLPRYLAQRNWKRYLLEYLPVFGFGILLLLGAKSYFADEFLDFHNSIFFRKGFIIELIINSLFIIIFIATLKFSEYWVKAESEKKQLENERLINEITLLRTQINPHFLFNTLNNLYALAYTQSPQTTVVIDKLSQIMRYMLQESQQREVYLTKEANLLENFVELEKLRLSNIQNISFQADSNSFSNVKIAPMILITFLENAFKHGEKGVNCSIKSSLKIINGNLFYKVENNKAKQNNVEKSGIGLQNAKRQLELFYKNRYTLDIQEDEQKYSVSLMIEKL